MVQTRQQRENNNTAATIVSVQVSGLVAATLEDAARRVYQYEYLVCTYLWQVTRAFLLDDIAIHEYRESLVTVLRLIPPAARNKVLYTTLCAPALLIKIVSFFFSVLSSPIYYR